MVLAAACTPLLHNTPHLYIEDSFETALKRLLTPTTLLPVVVLVVVVVGGDHPIYKCLPLILRLLRGVGFTFPHLLFGKNQKCEQAAEAALVLVRRTCLQQRLTAA